MTYLTIDETCFSKNLQLPYIIKYPSNKTKIAVFGDSFAELAECALNISKNGGGMATNITNDPHKRPFSHEQSWMYYISVIGNFEVHCYGVAGSCEKDIAYVFNNRPIDYDINIIHHTHFNRARAAIKDSKNVSLRKFFNRVKKDDCINISNYKFANSILKMDLINSYPFTNPIINDPGYSENRDPLDLEGGLNHMSNRGSLLFALDVLDVIRNKFGTQQEQS